MRTWIILRAAGIGAYVTLFLAVTWGLVATTSALGKKVSKATSVAIHQFVSTVALVLLAVHVTGVLLDRFVPFGPLDVFVPLHGAFRPAAVAFGIVGMYFVVVVLVSSWFRKRVGTAWWRRLHVLAGPAFTLAMLHGIYAGTDTIRPWMWWMYVATGGIVLFLLIVRALTFGLRPARRAMPAHARQTSGRDGRGFELGGLGGDPVRVLVQASQATEHR
jgi:methionine sulfoxide reductase heme-binding subunit